MKRFYHGTSMLIGDIDLSRSRNRTDFGKGFYMGTNLGESRKWAISQSMINEIAILDFFDVAIEIADEIQDKF